MKQSKSKSTFSNKQNISRSLPSLHSMFNVFESSSSCVSTISHFISSSFPPHFMRVHTRWFSWFVSVHIDVVDFNRHIMFVFLKASLLSSYNKRRQYVRRLTITLNLLKNLCHAWEKTRRNPNFPSNFFFVAGWWLFSYAPHSLDMMQFETNNFLLFIHRERSSWLRDRDTAAAAYAIYENKS